MPTTSTLAIPIAFLILAALLLWLIIDVRGKWWLKALLMILVVSFSITVWKSLDSYLGWPTSAALPKKAILIWIVVNEPNPKLGDPGAVYLWLKPREALPERPNNSHWALFVYTPNPNEPRTYKLPYSRLIHKEAQKALGLLMGDKSVEVEFRGRGKYGYTGSFSIGPGSVKFYELPPPKLPPKL